MPLVANVPPRSSCVSCTLTPSRGVSSLVASTAFSLTTFDPASSSAMGLSICIRFASLNLRTSYLLDVVGRAAVVKAVACWSVADPAVDGVLCLAAPLFTTFLPLALPLTNNPEAERPSAALLESDNDFADSLAALPVCFLDVGFLCFGLDDSSITLTSSSNFTAFLGLPRFFTASVDMTAQKGRLVLWHKLGVEF